MPRGAVLGLEETWALARQWYADRLDPDWSRPSAAAAAAIFRKAGLDGAFWSFDVPPAHSDE